MGGILSALKLDFQELEAYLSGYWLSDLANFSSYLYAAVEDVNWVGFYLTDGYTLRLGPFCGKPACMEIPFGRGVCGTAFVNKKSLIVDDVDQFPGHIRCDSRSKSELVIPLIVDGSCVGVFDIDSPLLSRFSTSDKMELEKAVHLLAQKIAQKTSVSFGKV